jgi:hypothetical protein
MFFHAIALPPAALIVFSLGISGPPGQSSSFDSVTGGLTRPKLNADR